MKLSRRKVLEAGCDQWVGDTMVVVQFKLRHACRPPQRRRQAEDRLLALLRD